jgi:signal transduction histidine kinase
VPLTIRVVVILVLVLMAITAAFDYVRLVQDRERLVEQEREDVRIFAETLALAVSRNIRWGRTSMELRELLEDILARPGLTAVAIFGPNADVVVQTVAADTDLLEADALVRQAIAAREPTSLVLETGPLRSLRHIQPFRWPEGRTGAIDVRQTLDAVTAEFYREVRERLAWRLLVLVAFVVSVTVLMRWSIARPIHALIRAAQALGRGDLGQRITLRRRDEIGQLGEAFNRMAQDLETARRDLVRESEERLRLEQEVHQAQKLAGIGRLAAEVAHEIGTPLNVIAGRAEVLERMVAADHPGRRHLGVIQAQADRISGIVRALLEYSRPRRPVFRSEAVVPILGRAAELLRERCRAKDVRIRLELTPGGPAIRGDAQQLQQVFINLLLNSIDASPRGGVIQVKEGPEPALAGDDRAAITRGHVPEPAVAVRIVDGGTGIPPERLPHIFQPFFSTKASHDGAGLGLSIVEEIVRAHGGAIEVATAPGRGTEVTVWLPQVGTRPGEPAPEPEPARATDERGR